MKTWKQYLEVRNIGDPLPPQDPQVTKDLYNQSRQQPQQTNQQPQKQDLIGWWQWVMQQNMNNMQLIKVAGALNQANMGLSVKDYYQAMNQR